MDLLGWLFLDRHLAIVGKFTHSFGGLDRAGQVVRMGRGDGQLLGEKLLDVGLLLILSTHL